MKIRSLVFAVATSLLFAIVPAASAVPALFGKIVDQSNKPISGVKIVVTQGGKQAATSTTSADGTYSFDLAGGAYSLQLVPPKSGYSTLNVYDILLPASQPITFALTPPTPGRSFVTGHVLAPQGFELSPSETSIGFANSASRLEPGTGFFKLLPTAGSSGSFSINGTANGDPFTFKMNGKTSLNMNQDAIVEMRVPLYRQRVRVLTSTGIPVSGASLYGGVGQNGLPSMSAMSPIEGLGAFEGNWLVQWMRTDANGYVNLPALSMAAPSAARFIVSVPSQYKFSGQTFNTTVGNGDVTLTLTSAIPLLSGTVKDLAGKAIDNAVVSVMDGNSGFGATTNAQGQYSSALAAGANYQVAVKYKDGAYAPNFMMDSWTDSANFAISADTTLNLMLPVNRTRVRVLDSKGAPVPNAYVSIKPKASSFTMYTGSWTLFPGKKPLNTYFYSTGTTDSQGYVSLPTMKLDSEIDGDVFASYGTSPNVSYLGTVQKIGFGKDLAVTILSSTVAVSGQITLTDGSPYNLSVSLASGKGQSAQLIQGADGKFVGNAPRAMTGQWYIGCSRVDITRDSDFCASISGGPTITANSDITQNFVVPSYKTPVQVVNADGKGIPNVKVLINSQMKGYGLLTLIPGQPAFTSYFLSVATTDANGMAYLTSLKMNSAQSAYMELTPDSNSRYETTGMTITVGNNSKNVVVLQIPKPVIYSVSVSMINGVKTATVNGVNFLGTFGVTAGTVSFNDFTNKVGTITTQGFKVVNTNVITFPVPTGLTTASVTVTNGGGSVTSGLITFNP